MEIPKGKNHSLVQNPVLSKLLKDSVQSKAPIKTLTEVEKNEVF